MDRHAADLRRKVIRSLQAQGFRVRDGAILPPLELSKEGIRALHETAVEHRIERAKGGLWRVEKRLLRHIASGHEVDPWSMSPRLVQVLPGSEEELLFRYASLHWSIPVSSGYGRRLRFLVFDDSNGKLVGLIGLGDPVFSLGPRDEWVGWSADDRRMRLGHVMDAFVLGAVPPYSSLLCGKLVAMMATSDTVCHAFREKYHGARSIIGQKVHDGRLALITTLSALGRSSVYNRLRIGDRTLFQRVGYTRGSGEFHFANGLYSAIREFVEEYCEPTAKQERWGTGFRNRREVVRKCLATIGLSTDCVYHGIRREVFVAPLACNSREFLRGEDSSLLWHLPSESQLFTYFRNRWMLPRASRDQSFKAWSKDEWVIWSRKESSRE